MSTNALVLTAIPTDDQTRVSVTVDGTPSGAVTFRSSRTPVYADAVLAPHVAAGGAVYIVQVSGPALWYVWALDANGNSADPAAVWCGTGDDDYLNEIGDALKDLIWANRHGLEARLRQLNDDVTLKQVSYGSATDQTLFPAVLVTEGSVSEEFVALPWTREHIYQFRVIAMVPHEDEQSRVRIGTRLAGAVLRILNSPPYESLTLPSGVVVNFCGAVRSETVDVQVDEKTWVAGGTLSWSCRALITDDPGS